MDGGSDVDEDLLGAPGSRGEGGGRIQDAKGSGVEKKSRDIIIIYYNA